MRPQEVKEVKATGRLWVDAQDWVIRKMKTTIEITNEKGQKFKIQPIIKNKDFREVNGLLFSYRTITMQGEGGVQLPPEQEQKMREALEEMRKQLEQMPEAQREMAEQMMKSQMEKIQKALGASKMVTEVEKVKINTGLPDDLFDGSKLK